MVSLLVGIVYFNQRLDQDGVMNINGALFIFLTNMTFQNVFAVINVKFICLYKNYIKIKRKVMLFLYMYVYIYMCIFHLYCVGFLRRTTDIFTGTSKRHVSYRCIFSV